MRCAVGPTSGSAHDRGDPTDTRLVSSISAHLIHVIACLSFSEFHPSSAPSPPAVCGTLPLRTHEMGEPIPQFLRPPFCGLMVVKA